ncbi:MAG: peptidylprolyl isomerase [Promethearchaeota archaeon]
MTKATLETNKGTIVIEFYDDETPNTVKNFVSLADSGYYNGVKFHRVISDFVVQGGDPTGTGSGGPGYKIADETKGPKQKHILGAISMANAGPNTNGSQFFIVLNPNSCKHLDGKHTVFGKVIEGMDVVQNIRQGDKMTKVTISEKTAKIENHVLKKL